MFGLSKTHKICRFYNEDLWGALRTKQELNNAFLRLVKQYREKKASLSLFAPVLITKRTKRKSLFGELLSFRRKLSIFYGGAKFPTSRWSSSPEQALHFLMQSVMDWELRLSTVVYRSHFASSILEANILVIGGAILVNKEVIKRPNYLVGVGEAVELLESFKQSRYNRLLSFLVSGAVVVYSPSYLEINHCLMMSIVVSKPKLERIPYPFQSSIIS